MALDLNKKWSICGGFKKSSFVSFAADSTVELVLTMPHL
jgi:hypothetical protein